MRPSPLKTGSPGRGRTEGRTLTELRNASEAAARRTGPGSVCPVQPISRKAQGRSPRTSPDPLCCVQTSVRQFSSRQVTSVLAASRPFCTVLGAAHAQTPDAAPLTRLPRVYVPERVSEQ